MMRTSFAATALVAILYSFTGLPATVDTCKWFDDNLNTDRDIGSLMRQTDLIYNRVALPADENVTIGASATSAAGDQLVDYRLGSKTVCSTAQAIYGPTPTPAAAP